MHSSTTSVPIVTEQSPYRLRQFPKTKGSTWNLFVDALATERVFKSGIKNFVAMAKAAQDMLVTDMTMIYDLGRPPVRQSPHLYNITGDFAACTNHSPPPQLSSGTSPPFVALMLQVRVGEYDSIRIQRRLLSMVGGNPNGRR